MESDGQAARDPSPRGAPATVDEEAALTEERALVRPRVRILIQGLRNLGVKVPLGLPEEPDDTSLTVSSEGTSGTLPHSIVVIQNRS